jgi:hypothetical protein
MIAEPPVWVRDVLSIPRFAPYLARADDNTEAAIRLYWWNVEISAAFYAPLHCLELAVRNAMHERLRIHFGRSDWWGAAPLNDYGRRAVTTAMQKTVGGDKRRYTSDDIVAELSFGFWVSLLSRGASYDRMLWVPALHQAFPHYRGRREPLHDNLLAMVLFRNRIMHHEPIHHRHLQADHEKIYRLIGYMSPCMAQELAPLDPVNNVLRKREEILALFGDSTL